MPEANDDMFRMQQDAIRRVQEMQSRAQQTLRGQQDTRHGEERREPHGNASGREPPREKHGEPSRSESHPAPPAKHPPAPAPIGDLFEPFLKDSERTMILVLLLLLISEDADTSLIFALMFLII